MNNLVNITSEFYVAAAPILVLSVGAIISMLQSVTEKISGTRAVFAVTIVSLLIGLGFSVTSPTVESPFLGGTYLFESLSKFGQSVLLTIALAVALLTRSSYLASRFFKGEIASLFMMVVTGMLVMVASDDLITMFIGLELSSIGLYALIGYVNPNRISQEGAVKYFILGSFASAFLLFSFALFYTVTGSMRISEIVSALPQVAGHPWTMLGALFLVVGIGFKTALAPFHMWAPDAYEAAPTCITALMATAAKVMILLVALRFFNDGIRTLYVVWLPGMMFLAICSIIVANILALVQNSLKRMLAYSSIAHSGYMAIAICAIGGVSVSLPQEAILFYVVGYSVISVAAFGILMWLENEKKTNLDLDDISGLAQKHPWASFGLAVCMFGFAGMPPTVGFMAKFFVFNAALSNELYSLAIIGVIGSAISLFYYLRVIVKMYMTAPAGEIELNPKASMMSTAIIGLAIVLSILFGTVLSSPMMTTMKLEAFHISQ